MLKKSPPALLPLARTLDGHPPVAFRRARSPRYAPAPRIAAAARRRPLACPFVFHRHRGRVWREWNLNGRRYFIEYGIRGNDGKAIVPTVFPYQYSFDMNRNGTFEVPGEVFVDIKGDGRCSDLQPVLQLASDRPA